MSNTPLIAFVKAVSTGVAELAVAEDTGATSAAASGAAVVATAAEIGTFGNAATPANAADELCATTGLRVTAPPGTTTVRRAPVAAAAGTSEPEPCFELAAGFLSADHGLRVPADTFPIGAEAAVSPPLGDVDAPPSAAAAAAAEGTSEPEPCFELAAGFLSADHGLRVPADTFSVGAEAAVSLPLGDVDAPPSAAATGAAASAIPVAAAPTLSHVTTGSIRRPWMDLDNNAAHISNLPAERTEIRSHETRAHRKFQAIDIMD